MTKNKLDESMDIKKIKKKKKRRKIKKNSFVSKWLAPLGVISIIILIISIVILYPLFKTTTFNTENIIIQECKIKPDNTKGIVKWIMAKQNKISIPKITEWVEFIFQKCKHPFLTIAIITYEGVWDPSFTSSAGAIGLGGIWPSEGKNGQEGNLPMLIKAGIIKTGKWELYDPKINILATDFMISYMREWGKGDIYLCLRYYRGLKKDKKGKVCPIDKRDLNKYTLKIMKAFWQLMYINNLSIEKLPIESGETKILTKEK